MYGPRRLENLREVLKALNEIVDKDGFCYGNAALIKIGERAGLSRPGTVRSYLRALESLQVVATTRAPGPKPLLGSANQPRLRFQLLKPDAVISERNGFFCVEEPHAKE